MPTVAEVERNRSGGSQPRGPCEAPMDDVGVTGTDSAPGGLHFRYEFAKRVVFGACTTALRPQGRRELVRVSCRRVSGNRALVPVPVERVRESVARQPHTERPHQVRTVGICSNTLTWVSDQMGRRPGFDRSSTI